MDDDNSPLGTKPGLNDEGIDVTEGSQGDDEGSHVTEGSQGDDEGIDSQGDDEGIDVTEGSQGDDEGIDVTEGSQDDGTQEKTSGQVSQSQSSGEEQRDENEDWKQSSVSSALRAAPTARAVNEVHRALLGGDGLRQRHGKKSATNAGNDWITTETESLGTSGIRRPAASASGNEHVIKMPPADNDQARTQEMPNNNARNSQRQGDGAPVPPPVPPPPPPPPPEDAGQQWWRQKKVRYLIWRFFLSLFGHGFLLGLSFIFGFGEETSGHHEEGNSRKWLKWGVMNLIVPLVVFIGMAIAQKLRIDPDDIPAARVKWCEIVSLAAITGSKVVYFAIRELPGVNVKVRFITAHAGAVVIDMASAFYLYRNHGRLDQDLPG